MLLFVPLCASLFKKRHASLGVHLLLPSGWRVDDGGGVSWCRDWHASSFEGYLMLFVGDVMEGDVKKGRALNS